MAILKKENVILEEKDAGKIAELELNGYEIITEAELKPKKETAKKGE